MYIDKITKLKGNKYKLNISNNEYVVYEDIIIKYNLLYNKSIDSKKLTNIIKDNKYYEVYNKCINLLLKHRKSEKEIRIYLDKFDISVEDLNSIINKLKDIKLIDDEMFAKAYLNDKLYISHQGINKIKKSLLEKGINEKIIDNIIKQVDYTELNNNLEKSVVKKIKSNKHYSNEYLRHKIINEAILDGYNKEEIMRILDNYILDDTKILENEFNKIYNKLSVKYKDKELNIKIKQKLISKGFNSDKINELLTKKTEE